MDTYVPTEEYEDLGIPSNITYGKGYVEGEIFSDVVRFTKNGFPCRIKILGVDYSVDNEGMNADGIVGLSPKESGNKELLVKKLYLTKSIDIYAFGVSYLFTDEQSKIIFGGWDKTIVPSLNNFTWFPLVNTNYWSINITGAFFAGVNLKPIETIGILDTGTSLLYLNYATFSQMWTKIKTKFTSCSTSNGWYY